MLRGSGLSAARRTAARMGSRRRHAVANARGRPGQAPQHPHLLRPVHEGRHQLAGAAPGRPDVDKNRLLALPPFLRGFGGAGGLEHGGRRPARAAARPRLRRSLGKETRAITPDAAARTRSFLAAAASSTGARPAAVARQQPTRPLRARRAAHWAAPTPNPTHREDLALPLSPALDFSHPGDLSRAQRPGTAPRRDRCRRRARRKSRPNRPTGAQRLHVARLSRGDPPTGGTQSAGAASDR